MCLWQRGAWPNFRWAAEPLLGRLASARHKQGRLLGRMQQLGFEVQASAEATAVTSEVVQSSAIEGELLNEQSVRSSVARHLGIPDAGTMGASDRRTEAVVEMAFDATRNLKQDLVAPKLWAWHAALLPTGYSGLHPIRVGGWRDDSTGPMQVVSGHAGRTRVHYVAPPAALVDAQMTAFLSWFNTPPAIDGLLRAAVAHLWFVTIHPFDDGNGRMARALTERALAQMEASEQRFYSLSAQIRRERNAYYDTLEATQKGNLDITPWLSWFMTIFERAIDAAELSFNDVLRRTAFWRRHADEDFNLRQRKVLNIFVAGFEGVLTAKKWAALAKCSVDTAQRDLTDLVSRGVLVKNPGGSKNTSYAIAPDSAPAQP